MGVCCVLSVLVVSYDAPLAVRGRPRDRHECGGEMGGEERSDCCSGSE